MSLIEALLQANIPQEQAESMIASYAEHGPNHYNFVMLRVAHKAGLLRIKTN